MHWLTEPGTSAPEEKRISVAACQDLREIPGVRNCGSHIGQALLADEVYGVDFGENWISVDEDVDYDETLASIHRTVEGYPGLYRDVQTYLRERIKEVLTGTSESIVVRIFGPDLDGPARKGRGDREADRRGRRGDRRARRLRRGPAARRGRAGPRCGTRHGLKPGRRPAPVVDPPRERGGRRHLLRRARPTTCTSGACPSARDSVTDVERAADRHPERRARAPRAGRRRARRADSEQHRARAPVAPDRRGRERRGS